MPLFSQQITASTIGNAWHRELEEEGRRRQEVHALVEREDRKETWNRQMSKIMLNNMYQEKHIETGFCKQVGAGSGCVLDICCSPLEIQCLFACPCCSYSPRG